MTLEPLSPRESSRIPEIDGLRGLAILLVLLWHCLVAPANPEPGSVLAYMAALLSFTWSGVDLFFILSGFLIGGILLDHRDSPRYYTTFYIRRFFRIVPIYFVVCSLLLVIARLHFNKAPGFTAGFGNPISPFALYTFTQNFWMGFHRSLGGFAFAPMWSLAVEEQFYLSLPFIVQHVSRRRLALGLAILCILAPLLRKLIFLLAGPAPGAWVWPFSAMPARADALGVGVLIAILVRSSDAKAWIDAHFSLIYAGAAVSVLIIGRCLAKRLTYDAELVATVGYSALAALYGALVLTALTRKRGWIAALFRMRWIRWIGSVAYGTYLIHMAILYLVFLVADGGRDPEVRDGRSLILSLVSIVASLAIARASWVLIEKRLVQKGHKFKY